MKTLIPSLLFLLHTLAQGAQIIVPNNLDSPAEGNTTRWPFTFSDDGITSRRYQQVYDASQFASIGSQGGYIDQLWFRADMVAFGGNASDFLDSVQINLGVTPRSPDSLSAVFSENIGTVYATVYGPSPLTIATQIGWTIIPLTQPFLYVPADGNLLLDIRTIDATPYPFAARTLDGEDTVGDSISAVFASDVNATTGVVSTRALVTLFRVEPIPEPGTWGLLGLGLLGTWRFSRRK